MQTDCLLLCGNTPKFPLLNFCCLCSELPWRAKVKFKFKTSNRTDFVVFTLLSGNLILLQFELDFFFNQTRHKIVCSFPSFRGFAEDIRICHGSAGNARWPDPCRKQPTEKKIKNPCMPLFLFFGWEGWGVCFSFGGQYSILKSLISTCVLSI